jgi:hypothetical protein
MKKLISNKFFKLSFFFITIILILGLSKTFSLKPEEIKKVISKPPLTEKIIQETSAEIYDQMYSLLPPQNETSFKYTQEDSYETGIRYNNDYIGKYKYAIGLIFGNTTYDDGYITGLTITDGEKELYNRQYDKFAPIGEFEIKTKDQTTRIFQIYTYGAHCCVSLVPVTVKNDKLFVGEPLDVKNTDIVDKSHFFVQDNNLYKVIFDDRFAYYDMSFVESKYMFFPLIYLIDEKGFTPVPKQFKDYYEKLYQSINSQIIKLNKYEIDSDARYPQENYIIATSILRYSIGHLAGHNRENLKRELLTTQTPGLLDEEEIFNFLSNTKTPIVDPTPIKITPTPKSLEYINQSVTYFGYIKRISTSGEARFRWYDTKLEQVKDLDNQYAWFLAMPIDVPNNE